MVDYHYKDDDYLYTLEGDDILYVDITTPEIDTEDIPHLDSLSVLFHYKSNLPNDTYITAVILYTNTMYIMKNGIRYDINFISNDLIKDYTLINLKLI